MKDEEKHRKVKTAMANLRQQINIDDSYLNRFKGQTINEKMEHGENY